MSAPAPLLQHDPSEAEHFLTLLDEGAESFCFRVFDDDEGRKDPRLAGKYEGALADVWSHLVAAQSRGCGVYVVANAGAQVNDSIYKVRAVFADTDGAPLGPILACGLEPHIVVESSPDKWHVYWLVDGLPLDAFRDVQRSIAARFGTDKSVNDLARVMRLPGLFHQKQTPFRTRIIHESGALPYPAETILEHFAPVADTAPAPSPGLDSAVLTDRHADVLKCALLLGAAVRTQAMTRAEALSVMYERRAAGRWSRHVPDDEIVRALDGAIRRGGSIDPTDPDDLPGPRATALSTSLAPFSPEDMTAAAVPHPHAFMSSDGERGLFPEGEVTVIGAPGREGKTTLMMAIATHYALGWPLAGLAPTEVRSVLIYSAEDDRGQYARKAAAQWARMSADNQPRLLDNLIVPDLHSADLAAWREIVRLENRQPVRGAIVEPLIEAVSALRSRSCPPGLAIFETASTLSDAEEDNPGHKALIAALKHFAKQTGMATILVHHTSQSASNELPELNLSESAIRGGTTLVNNARQTHLVVNLASAADPFPESDARTLLRSLVAPGEASRITALICLSSSKSADPAPIFMRWDVVAPYGPRMVEVEVPASLRGKSWRAIKALLAGARADAKADKKAEAGAANVRLVVRAVCDISERGEQATARKVSTACGRNPGWAKPFLDAAVEGGELVRSTEQVPRGTGLTDVYRPIPEAHPWQIEQETR